MRHSLTGPIGVALAVLGLVATGPAAGQPNAASLPGVFSEVLDVRVVNLEVVVTDRDGVAVRGLRPDDFILEVDGEEVAIEYFSEIRGGVATIREPGEEGPPRVAELPAVVPGDPVETSYLVFIDEFFAIARDRDRVIRALSEELPRLGPSDRMAVVAFNGKDLEMVTTWSQSVPALQRSLERALERPTFGLQRLSEQRQLDFDSLLSASARIRSGELSVDRFLRTDLTPSERFYVERLTEQIQQSVTAAASALRSFARPPGRKVLLLYSGGWPFFPTTFLGSNVSPVVLTSDLERGVGLFRPLTDTANLLGYTIYAVDMPGFADVLSSGLDGLGAVRSSAVGGPQQSTFLRQQEVQYTLRFLAQQTGGLAMIDSQRLEAFERVVSDTRSYYWLGFTPARDWDDRRHEVEVGMRQPGLRVRNRENYLDSSREHEVAMALESTLLFGNPAGSEDLEVVVGEPRPSGRKRMEVPITLFVPLSEVTFLPDGQSELARLELRVAVRDQQGRRAPISFQPVAIEKDARVSAEAVGRYETVLRLRRQRHDAVIGLYDPASGRILTASIEISP